MLQEVGYQDAGQGTAAACSGLRISLAVSRCMDTMNESLVTLLLSCQAAFPDRSNRLVRCHLGQLSGIDALHAVLVQGGFVLNPIRKLIRTGDRVRASTKKRYGLPNSAGIIHQSLKSCSLHIQEPHLSVKGAGQALALWTSDRSELCGVKVESAGNTDASYFWRIMPVIYFPCSFLHHLLQFHGCRAQSKLDTRAAETASKTTLVFGRFRVPLCWPRKLAPFGRYALAVPGFLLPPQAYRKRIGGKHADSLEG